MTTAAPAQARGSAIAEQAARDAIRAWRRSAGGLDYPSYARVIQPTRAGRNGTGWITRPIAG